ncbi:ATP-binding protein [Siccirubricoccus phaeus]|uniref:ATP-binding protein n=1 Tax=Siccirubricoccus phaeus TaxID=2595053 RepID=UPI001F2CEF06|nr:ATP-binding protein [Siccirubricoccus phaeus]
MTVAASVVLHGGSAAICLAWTLLILAAARGPAAWLLAAACGSAGLWAAAVALVPDTPLTGPAGVMEVLRDAAWGLLLLRLQARIAGGTPPLLRRLAWLGAGFALLALAGLLPELLLRQPVPPGLAGAAGLARIGLALTVVLLAENLYRNADEALRWHVNLPAIALGGLAAFDVLLFVGASFSGGVPGPLLDARAALAALSAPLLAVAAVRDGRWRRDLPVSRRVAFHGATLVVAGACMLLAGAAGEAMRHLDERWGEAGRAVLLAGALMALAVALSSASMRSRLRRLVVDHFFTARYDYRQEWLRCVDILFGPDGAAPAESRAIRAIADAVDSPGGVLLLAEGEGQEGAEARLRWAGSWNMPPLAAPVVLPAPLAAAQAAGEVFRFEAATPPVLAGLGPLWLAVPLPHHRNGPGSGSAGGPAGAAVGLVLLAPPRAAFPLDREVFELLRTLGREVALFLAERAAAQRLAEQRQLQDLARRFAFVAHDVKTVSSQLSLLLANAEANIQDPEFQRDMLLTVRASADRINALIARLRQPEEAAAAPELLWPEARLRALLAARPHPVALTVAGAAGPAAMAPEEFDAAFGHLLNNAAEASPPGDPVRVTLSAAPGRVVVEIADAGPGMTPEFIRDELFRPLSTSKPGGSGIGAWQARELLREAGGELLVESRPGAGTTMRLVLPAAHGPYAGAPAPAEEARA